jgi:FixJ family two-component response regulator
LKVPVISIVDDDDSARRAMTNLIRSLGYVAAAFPSAEAFLGSDRLDETDCLITDLQMPGLNGVELQDALLARGKKTPMIFVTAFGEERFRKRALDAGAIAFLSKPFDEARLIAHIQSVLHRRNGNTQES